MVPHNGPDGTKVRDEILKAVKVLHRDGDAVELRAFVSERGYSKTYTGWFNDVEKLAEEAVEFDRQGGDVYITLNPVKASLLARSYNKTVKSDPKTTPSTSDPDILMRRWIPIDCDPRRASGISATDEEKAAALDRARTIKRDLEARGFPELVLADSGNGAHVLIPVTLANDKEATKLVERFLKALGFQYSDDAVEVDLKMFNAARITKAYGVTARKGQNVPELGRVHRPSRILSAPETRTDASLELIQAIADSIPEEPKHGGPKKGGFKFDGGSEFDLHKWIEDHDVPVKREGEWGNGGYRWVLEECIWNGHTDNSAYIVQLPSGGISAGCAHNSCQADGNRWREVREYYEPDAYSGARSAEASGTVEDADTPKRSQADRLIDYALETGAELFCDQLGAPHALVDGEALALNSRCHPWLRRLLWEHEKRSAGRDALGQAAGTLAAFALHSGNEHELHTRAAFHDGAVYYQLGKGRVVEISALGWGIVSTPPVLFRSIPNLKDLPNPVRGGSLEALYPLINLKEEQDKRLFDAYMTTALIPHIARPMIQPTGVQGSGKTTLSRIIKRALDPTAPEAVRMDPRDFLQKASHAYIVMLDNQPSLPDWAADMLCRLVTGESDSKRQLYTDDEDVIVEMRRAILINGINTPSDRGDVQERTLPLELDLIPEDQRRSERVMWGEFNRAHAGVLGAIFDALSATLRLHETLTFGNLPRLADWAEYAIAAYEHFGWGADQFYADWGAVKERQNEGTVDGSAVAQTIISIMKVHPVFEKTSSDMLEALENEAEKLNINIKRDKTWPKSPSWLWRRIKEVLPALAGYGIRASQRKKEAANTIRLELIGGGDGPDGSDPAGSNPNESWKQNQNASRFASSPDPADRAEPGSTGSTGSKNGHLSGSLSRTPREK